MWELGIIGKVDKIVDDKMRFYAFIGLAISTAAAIEHGLFDCFDSATGGDKKANAQEFYKSTDFKHKRDLADKAVRARLTDRKTLETWNDIICELDSVCGRNSARNLVGHNPLITSFLVRRNDDGTPDLIGGSAVYSEDSVRQNWNVVLAEKRKNAKHTLKTFRQYAYDICGAHMRLYEFHQRYLATPS